MDGGSREIAATKQTPADPTLAGAPVRIAAAYLVVGIGWILASDAAVNLVFDASVQTQRFQLVKGLLYVATTALLLFLLVKRFTFRASEALARLEASERKLLKLADEVPVALLVLTDGVIAQANLAAAQMLGDGSAAALVGRAVNTIVAEEDRGAFNARLKALDGHGDETLACNFRTVTGALIAVEVGVSASCVGIPGSLLLCALNVSKRRHLEGQLRLAQKEQLVGRIAAGIAHDFNNLITAILGYAELSKTGLPPGHASGAYLKELEATGRQAAAVLGGMLTLARKDASVRVPVSVGTLVDNAARLARGLLPSTIETKIDMGVGGDRMVLGDSVQLKQAILNLAANAGDAMPKGGTLKFAIVEMKPEVAFPPLAVGSVSSPGRIRISVCDTGSGIAPADIEHIFEPFFTTKIVGSGTGLGLAITKRIVDDHGGKIVVESKPGAGTTFSIELPVAEPTAAIAGTVIGDSVDVERVALVGGPETASLLAFEDVLIVEDDPRVRALLEQWFGRLAKRCEAVADAEAFLAAFAADLARFDLFVIDHELPTSSGRRLIENVRAARPDVPILYISGGLTDPPMGDEKTHALAKPFGFSELEAAVKVLRTVN